MQTARRALPIDRKPLAVLSVAAAGGLLADQVTKAIALSALSEGETVPFIEGVWHWTLQRNPGAAFSILTRAPVVFTIIAIGISIGILWYARKVRDAGLGLALGLVLGGALGNLSDRMFRPPGPFRGHVIDFIDFRIWPTFNVADMGIVAGAGLLFVHSVRAERAERAARAERERAGREHNAGGESGEPGDAAAP